MDTPGSSQWIRVDVATGAVEEATRETATHAPVEHVQLLEAQVEELKETTQRLHDKLQRQIRNKANWRDKALAAQGRDDERRQLRETATAETDGEERQRLNEKGEIRPFSGKHYRVLVLETDGGTDQEALAQAEEFARLMTDEHGIAVLVGRLWCPEEIEWFAEILVPLPSERSMAPQPPSYVSMNDILKAARGGGGGGGGPKRKRPLYPPR